MRLTLFLLGLPIIDLTVGRADPFDALLAGSLDHEDVDITALTDTEED